MALRATMRRSDIVDKFMSLTIDEYLFHISGDTERAEERIEADIEYYREKTLCCPKYELPEGATLKDLAHRIEVLSYRWKDTSEEERTKLIHSCNEDLYYFLIKYVRKKYHDMFDVGYQCE